MKHNFTVDLKVVLERKAPMEEIVALLREHRDRGLTQQEALFALEALRGGADEASEDRILEVLDVVSGFCAPHLRVWPPLV